MIGNIRSIKRLGWLGLGVFLSMSHAAESVTRAEVCADGVARRDAVAEGRIELPDGERVLTVRAADGDVAFQADPDDGGVALTVLLEGPMAPRACRSLDVLSGEGSLRAVDPLVSVDQLGDYRGEAAFRIATPRATYYYHRGGSGFASLIDQDGNDWISYQPVGGFEGSYRGIPNIAPPQFHPGRPEGKKASRLLHAGPLKATILSETDDETWRIKWEVFPAFARMTLLAKGPEPYWILYEGTPGGSFNPDSDFWRDSAGRELPMPAAPGRWSGKLPDPQWVLFGDREVRRGLFLALHDSDDHWDEFWHRGAGGMTVFGFGRGPKPQWQYLDAVPLSLTIGFIEDNSLEAATAAVESAWRPIRIRVRR